MSESYKNNEIFCIKIFMSFKDLHVSRNEYIEFVSWAFAMNAEMVDIYKGFDYWNKEHGSLLKAVKSKGMESQLKKMVKIWRTTTCKHLNFIIRDKDKIGKAYCPDCERIVKASDCFNNLADAMRGK